MVLDLEDLDVARAAQALPLNVFEELGVGERLLLVLGGEEVGGFHDDDTINEVLARNLLAQALEGAYLHVVELPVVALVGEGVVLYALCGEVADEVLVLELIQREAVAALDLSVEVVDIGDDAGIYLQLHVLGHLGFLSALVLHLELQALHGAAGDDLGAEVEADDCQKG